MLVLTRKVQEQIKVGNDITITIIRVKGQSVRVGIEAPRDVRVMRSELSQSDELPTDEIHETETPATRHEAIAPNPEMPHAATLPVGDRMKGMTDETQSEVVGPRRLVAPRGGPLSPRMTRQAVADLLEMTSN